MLNRISGLMDKGKPVGIVFTEEEGGPTSLLYCELVQKARFGESFLIKNQGCKVGEYVLGNTETSPVDYYYRSKRYLDRKAAEKAVSNLKRLAARTGSIKITPYSGGAFDVLILFLKPERAMRIIQAFSYKRGEHVELRTGGIASVCSDCTAYPIQGCTGMSLGCKGSRKHSRYADEELVVGLPFQTAGEIEAALGKIPETSA